MENEGNLRVPTSEEARENGRKGGKASAEARRRKKTFKNVFESLMREDIGKSVPLPQHISVANKISVQEAIAITVAAKAVKGDLSAASFVRDTLGEKPTDDVNLKSDNTITVNIRDLTDGD